VVFHHPRVWWWALGWDCVLARGRKEGLLVAAEGGMTGQRHLEDWCKYLLDENLVDAVVRRKRVEVMVVPWEGEEEGSSLSGLARHVSPIGEEDPGQTDPYQQVGCSCPMEAEISSTLRQEHSTHGAYHCMNIASLFLLGGADTDRHTAEHPREHEAGKAGIASSRDRGPDQQQKEARKA
jgi:hypothetical protein